MMAMIEADMEADTAERPSLDPREFIAFILQADNLAAEMDETQLDKIGKDVCDDYDMDKESMQDWLDKAEKAIDLAKLVKEDKTYPFSGASNIKYPLVTSAALQFNARAYPAIVPPSDLVKTKVWGPDPQGQKASRGERVSSFMTWQLLVEMEEWEKQIDTLLVQLPIVGDMFRKIWHDGQRIRTKLIEPGRFIVNTSAPTITDAPRVSEEFDLYPHEIEERVRSGWFIECDYERDPEDGDAPQCFVEMHCRLDLDEDGYEEPYVVTIHKEKQKVVRLVADFEDRDVVFDTETQAVPVMVQTPAGPVMSVQQQEVATGIQAIRRNSYFVHYQMMPGMSGGLLGTGLGTLLADISEAVNTSFNMLMDAGHYASLGGGFIGTEFRIKGGHTRMRPGEYKLVNSEGDDIRRGVVDKTFPGPDAVLFQMLGMLIEAGREISSTKDIITNESARNMTATTTMALVEQGMKVFTAAYKRIFRALKREFRLIANINARTLAPEKYAQFLEEQHDPAQDFAALDMDIEPVADPNAVTKMQEMAKAQLVMDLAQAGMVHPPAAGQRVLEAASIEDTEELAPPPPDPAIQQAQAMDMQMSLALKQAELGKAQAEIEKTRASVMEMMAGVQNDADKLRLDSIIAFLEQNRAQVQQAIDMAQLAQPREQ